MCILDNNNDYDDDSLYVNTLMILIMLFHGTLSSVSE